MGFSPGLKNKGKKENKILGPLFFFSLNFKRKKRMGPKQKKFKLKNAKIPPPPPLFDRDIFFLNSPQKNFCPKGPPGVGGKKPNWVRPKLFFFPPRLKNLPNAGKKLFLETLKWFLFMFPSLFLGFPPPRGKFNVGEKGKPLPETNLV